MCDCVGGGGSIICRLKGACSGIYTPNLIQSVVLSLVVSPSIHLEHFLPSDPGQTGEAALPERGIDSLATMSLAVSEIERHKLDSCRLLPPSSS